MQFISKWLSLDTESFLAALSRFESRRGTPKKIFSDNGTNFTGADRELRSMVESFNQKKIHERCLRKNIQWHFIPPSASHMGGVWERIVKSVKRVLRAVLKEVNIQDETLITALCQVEKILNDRPMTVNSGDPNDPDPLTPNKLLLLKGNPCVPPGTFHEREKYYNRRFKQAHIIADQFWSRWIKEYLPLLQERSKWFDSMRNLRIGDVVLVCDDNTPRGQWPMGVVEDVHTGRDELVRSVTVRCGQRRLVRPVVKLCLLEETQ